MAKSTVTGTAAKIAEMVDWLKGDPGQVAELEKDAASELLRMARVHYPHNGCAATLWTLLKWAGVDVGETMGAKALGDELERSGWKRIAVGDQQDGDVGTTCIDKGLRPGSDHIYFVLHAMGEENLVIDNQATNPHFRYNKGHGKTATTHFLRAPE